MGYSYDTSTALTVNSAVPVIVHLPSTGNATHQVFALDIQREAKYLISAKAAGTDDIDLNIQVYENYEEGSEHTFVQAGFAGESVPAVLQEEAVEEHHQFECSLEHIGKRIQADAVEDTEECFSP